MLAGWIVKYMDAEKSKSFPTQAPKVSHQISGTGLITSAHGEPYGDVEDDVYSESKDNENSRKVLIRAHSAQHLIHSHQKEQKQIKYTC